jgi:hypothetical protein
MDNQHTIFAAQPLEEPNAYNESQYSERAFGKLSITTPDHFALSPIGSAQSPWSPGENMRTNVSF